MDTDRFASFDETGATIAAAAPEAVGRLRSSGLAAPLVGGGGVNGPAFRA